MEIYKGKGTWCRRKSVDYIIDEIKTVRKQYGLKLLYFNDENFSMNKKWTEEFLTKYIEEINLPYICVIKLSNIDENIVRLLKASKCKGVLFGVETGSLSIRKVLNRKDKDEEMMQSTALLHKNKIASSSYNMLGLPDETIDDSIKTIKLNSRLKVSYPWVTVFKPFPKTELEEYCIKKNYIKRKEDSDDSNEGLTFFDKSLLDQPHSREFFNLSRLFSLAVKFPKQEKLLRKLIKMRPNFLFEMVFLGYTFYRELFFMRRPVMYSFVTGYKNFMIYFKNRKK